MTNNLYLLYNFNNYFNRKLIKHDTLQQYLNAVNNDYDVIQNCVNFNPNDGVSTEQIINVGAYNTINLRQPNYMLVVDEHNDIQQRWFVVDAPRTRAGQMKLELQRDVVADSWEVVKTAPIFVEKAIVAENDPAIWNDENVELNQIKQGETLLKDSTGCPWIVGYMTTKNVDENNIILPGSKTVEEYATLSAYPYYQYIHQQSDNNKKFLRSVNKYNYRLRVHDIDRPITQYSTIYYRYLDINEAGNTDLIGRLQSAFMGLRILDASKKNDFGKAFVKYTSEINNYIQSAVIDTSEKDFETFKAEDGKIIRLANGTTYKIALRKLVEEQSDYSYVYPRDDSGFTEAIKTAVDLANDDSDFFENTRDPDNKPYFAYKVSIIEYELVAELLTENYLEYKISNDRKRIDNQPYSIFAMPCGTTTIYHGNTPTTKDYSDISLAVAKDISARYGGETPQLYDLQLLPYCPLRNIMSNGFVKVAPATVNTRYNYVKQGGANVGIILWVDQKDVSFNITYSVDVSGRKKLENECSFYRLCSPNWNGQFEFNASKNNGISYIHVDMTCKPYQPYIHLNPDFKGLYGNDYNDARGLICGGKFDLPQTSDAWSTYERQNTNYNAIFNRQIENLEVQQKYQRWGDILGAVSGTATNAANGAAMGAAVGTSGGPAGMIAGGIIGGVAGAGAGIADVYVSDKLRAEQMDYTKDMYSMRIQNIKAQPDSLVSVGALTANNKIFPVLEHYSCTDKERTAVADKIKYNGMTVNRIGTINEFKNNLWLGNEYNYFKGKLIRIDVPDEDWHFVNVLKSELDRGIFIKRGEP